MSLPVRWSAVLAISVVLVAPVWAKGVTVAIVVSGVDMPAPLSITDPEVCRQFSIWSGPRSRWWTEQDGWQTDYSRSYIDFPGGTVDAPPAGTHSFDVEFYIAGSADAERFDETYKVRYALRPSEPGGYMYLPRGNPFIHHGVEGNWFRSTDPWEDGVRPLILEWLDEHGAVTDTD